MFSLQAVSWCPWQATLLATGGGTSDRYIRFWNVVTGSCVKAVDTESQVKLLLEFRLCTDVCVVM